MSKGDLLVERGAQRLQELADRASARGDGIGEWLSDELRTDAAFLRKLKPSLVAARAKGESPSSGMPSNDVPTNEGPTSNGATSEEPAEPPTMAPPPPPPGPKAKKRPRRPGGPSPLVIVGAALVAGIMLAKIVDWRGHAHPRD